MVTYTKQSKWIELKKELFPSICQYCKKEQATQLAHALFYKRYKPGQKNAKVRDVRENALPTCNKCAKFSETYEGRLVAWEMLKKREGVDRMIEWYDSFPSKIKEILT